MNKITAEILIEWEACEPGYNRFVELFPDGATLKDAADRLADDGRPDWSIWLYNKCRCDERFKNQAIEGFKNTGHRNTGHQNTGDQNTGKQNTGDQNTGHQNTGHQNTGDQNTGRWNTGDQNTGHWNTGKQNTGNQNTGDQNTGDQNTGRWNTGDQNTGHWNTGDWNTGNFNTVTPSDILVFNKPAKTSDWDAAQKPSFIYQLELTWWVDESQMTDEEKATDPNFYMRGGQLRSRTYKEAWRKAWDETTDTDRRLVLGLPNFDPAVFLEITGINVIKELNLGESNA